MRWLRLLALLCACVAPAAVRSQSGTAAIGGVVTTDEAPGRPLRRVTVTLAESGGAIVNRMATSNETGKFMFRDLPAGRYTISASLPPYLPGAYGARRVAGPGSVQTGTAIVLADGQVMTDLSIRLARGAVITGTVRDFDGTPARSAMVSLGYFQRSPVTGERQLTQYYGAGLVGNQTDDRGVYRLYGLPPGDYIVGAVLSTGIGRMGDLTLTTDADVRRTMDLMQRPGPAATPAVVAAAPARRPSVGYVPVFYPGTLVPAEAQPITLGVGEERSSIDLQLQRVSTARIEGVVLGMDGAPAARASVRSTLSNAPLPAGMLMDIGMFMGFSVSTDAQGRFTLSGLPPGGYLLQAFLAPATPGGQTLWAASEVAVQGDDTTTTLTLQPGNTVNGRIVLDAAAATPAPDLSRVRISLVAGNPVPGLGSFGTTVQPTGEFSIAGVVPGRYRLMAAFTAPALQGAWPLKSATLKGQESLDVPVEIRAGDAVTDAVITFSDRATELSGAMVDASNAPASEYFIIVFAEDRAYWTPGSRRILQTRPSRDGRFLFRNLPPGDYRLAAVTDIQQGEWFDPAFLGQLVAASVKVTLGANEKKVQDLRVGR